MAEAAWAWAVNSLHEVGRPSGGTDLTGGFPIVGRAQRAHSASWTATVLVPKDATDALFVEDVLPAETSKFQTRLESTQLRQKICF